MAHSIRPIPLVGATLLLILAGTACGSHAEAGQPKQATAVICDDIVKRSGEIMAPISDIDPSRASVADLETYLARLKTALIQWAQLMRDDANKVDDAGFAAALRKTAGEIDHVSAELNSLPDLNGPALQDLSNVGKGAMPYCPKWKDV